MPHTFHCNFDEKLDFSQIVVPTFRKMAKLMSFGVRELKYTFGYDTPTHPIPPKIKRLALFQKLHVHKNGIISTLYILKSMLKFCSVGYMCELNFKSSKITESTNYFY